MADNCGPYLAALSYSSNRGIASSFIFLGTANTSVVFCVKVVSWVERQNWERTFFRHLNEEKLFALFWFCDMGWNERVLYVFRK